MIEGNILFYQKNMTKSNIITGKLEMSLTIFEYISLEKNDT